MITIINLTSYRYKVESSCFTSACGPYIFIVLHEKGIYNFDMPNLGCRATVIGTVLDAVNI